MEEKIQLRRFSLEEDFMNFSTNDLLYGFMRGLSTAKPLVEDGKFVKNESGKQIFIEYLAEKTYMKNRKTIVGICNCTLKTINNNLKKLIEAGLVEEGTEIINGVETRVFYFPYNEDENYKLIDKEIIKYLVDTRNSQAIRVYLYLRNKFEWKKDYIFTIKEIKLAMGYAETTKTAESMIRNILTSFHNEGMMTIEVFSEMEVLDNGKEIPVERMKLKNVVCDKENLPQMRAIPRVK